MKKKTLLLALIVTLSSLIGCKVSTPSEPVGGSSGTSTYANDSVDSGSGKPSDNSTQLATIQHPPRKASKAPLTAIRSPMPKARMVKQTAAA